MLEGTANQPNKGVEDALLPPYDPFPTRKGKEEITGSLITDRAATYHPQVQPNTGYIDSPGCSTFPFTLRIETSTTRIL